MLHYTMAVFILVLLLGLFDILAFGSADFVCRFTSQSNQALYGFNYILYENVHLDTCKAKCLSGMDGHDCLSFDYTDSMDCYLSTESAQTQPHAIGFLDRCDYYEKVCDTKLEDCKSGQRGADYTGNIAHTVSGRVCQRWDSQHPHKHNGFDVSWVFPDGEDGFNSNYCRNPTEQAEIANGGPWCYTTDPDVRWEFCHIPECSDDCDAPCYDNPCSGKTPSCFLQLAKFCSPEFCSNCNAKFYNDNGDTVAVCDAHNGPPPFGNECRTTASGVEYAGRVSVTKNGKTCQRWDSQFPHEHNMKNPLAYPDLNISRAENFCRNPDNHEGGLWCYTTDPGARWELCEIDECKASCINPEMHGLTLHESDNCYKFHWGNMTRSQAEEYCDQFSTESAKVSIISQWDPLIMRNVVAQDKLNPTSAEYITSMWLNKPDGDWILAVIPTEELVSEDKYNYGEIDPRANYPFICVELK